MINTERILLLAMQVAFMHYLRISLETSYQFCRTNNMAYRLQTIRSATVVDSRLHANRSEVWIVDSDF